MQFVVQTELELKGKNCLEHKDALPMFFDISSQRLLVFAIYRLQPKLYEGKKVQLRADTSDVTGFVLGGFSRCRASPGKSFESILYEK